MSEPSISPALCLGSLVSLTWGAFCSSRLAQVFVELLEKSVPCQDDHFSRQKWGDGVTMNRFMGLDMEGREILSPTLRLLLVLLLPVRPVWWWGLALLSLMAFFPVAVYKLLMEERC